MGHLDRVDAEFLLEVSTFYRALDHAVRLVTGHAEGRLPSARTELEMVSDLLYRWTGTTRQPVEIDSALAHLQEQTRSLFERVFS